MFSNWYFIVLGVVFSIILFNFKKIKLGYIYYIAQCYYDFPIKQKDFPQVFLKVDLKKYYVNLKEIAAKVFETETLLQILYKGNTYPILSFIKKAETTDSKKLLVLAGIHGNETGGVLAIPELLKFISAEVKKYANWEIKIVTPLNPVGVIEMSRYNKNGCDINRKINNSNLPEIKLQRDLINSFQPDITVSFHEAPSSGFLIHPNALVPKSLSIELVNYLKNSGIHLASKDYLERKLKEQGISEISGALKILKKIVKLQPLSDYAEEKGILEITTESGWNTDDALQRIDSHKLLIIKLLEIY